MTLGDAKVGTTVVVTKIEGDGAYKRRIMDMGITKGSELYIRKVAPLGDPVETFHTDGQPDHILAAFFFAPLADSVPERLTAMLSYKDAADC